MSDEDFRERSDRVVEEFLAHDDWIARYQHLVALGDAMPALPAADRTDESRIPGCQSQLWICAEYDPEEHVVHFRADSDARITRGMAAILIRVLDGQSPEVIAEAKLGFVDEIGLNTHLSAQRRNGLAAMVHWMKERARTYAATVPTGANLKVGSDSGL